MCVNGGWLLEWGCVCEAEGVGGRDGRRRKDYCYFTCLLRRRWCIDCVADTLVTTWGQERNIAQNQHGLGRCDTEPKTGTGYGEHTRLPSC